MNLFYNTEKQLLRARMIHTQKELYYKMIKMLSGNLSHILKVFRIIVELLRLYIFVIVYIITKAPLLKNNKTSKDILRFIEYKIIKKSHFCANYL